MKKLIKNQKKGILFRVTGLSGSGKTTISQKIKNRLTYIYGPTLLVSGDNLRRIFGFKNYSYKERLKLSKKFCKFAKFITDQKINLIFAVVGMMHAPRNWCKKNVDNYVEIYIKPDIKKIINLKKKKIYHNKNSGDLVGVSIKPELPRNPNIVLKNDFKKTSKELANNLIKKIEKII
jgi:adenylylsulfate kinase-like enzyme